MRLLSESSELAATISELFERFRGYRLAVAWASSGFPLCDVLISNRDRVTQLVVGTHFYQTHPDFLEAFVDHPSARVFHSTSGVFHPKLYLFENSASDWTCVVGSPNFTRSAFSGNDEVAVLFNGDGAAYQKLRAILDGYWDQGRRIDDDFVRRYRSLWRVRRRERDLLADHFGESITKTPILDVDVLSCSWPEFLAKAKQETDHSFEKRLAVLDAAHELFTQNRDFAQMSQSDKAKVAGYASEREFPWRYFGSMAGAIRFKKAIKDNHPDLGQAVDSIPLMGQVTREDYDRFATLFRRAFPAGGAGLAVASRLLAMKRPDQFVCIDTRNRAKLCREIGVEERTMTLDRYWEQVIERVRATPWWASPRPTDAEEERAWRGRVALLDSWYYEPAAK